MSIVILDSRALLTMGGAVVIAIASHQSINQSTLFNEGDTQQCSTGKLVALEFLIELEFRNVGI